MSKSTTKSAPRQSQRAEGQGQRSKSRSSEMTHQESGCEETNVSLNERVGSLVGGAALAMFGLRRRSNLGAILAFVGGSLIYRGATGHCSVYEAMGKNTANESGGD